MQFWCTIGQEKSRLYVTSGVAQEDNKQTGARNLTVFEAKCFVLLRIVATRVFAKRLVFSGVEQSVKVMEKLAGKTI